MATQKGVWNLQQVRDKQLQSLWDYQIGEMYAWGNNTYGTLAQNDRGPGNSTARSSPTQVPGTNWASTELNLYRMTVSEAEYLAIKSDGTLWSWGDGGEGALGHNNRTDYSSPTQIGSGTDWYRVENGPATQSRHHAIKTDGTLWSWGSNTSGCLGINQPANVQYSSPTQVPGTTWKEVSNSENLFAGIKTDGTLWICGDNNDGQQMNGQPSNVHISSPVQVPGTDWDHVYSGKYAYWVMKTDKTLWNWGYNGKGSLGHNQQGNSLTSPHQLPGTWSQLSGGSYITAGIKTDGTLWMWGDNNQGAIAQNDSHDAGNTGYSSPVQIPGTDWIWVSCSSNALCTYALKSDNTLWAWGGNPGGSLGVNSVNNGYSSPVQIPGTDWGGVVGGYGGAVAFKNL